MVTIDGRRGSKEDWTPPIRLAGLGANAVPLSRSSYVLLSSVRRLDTATNAPH